MTASYTYSSNDRLYEKIAGMSRWLSDSSFFESAISRKLGANLEDMGHAFMHESAGQLPTDYTMDTVLAMAEQHNSWESGITDDATLQKQLSRVVNECTTSSNFADKYAMLYTAYVGIGNNIGEIAKWIDDLESSFQYGDKPKQYKFTLNFDAGKFIGSGINVNNGLQYTTSAATMVLQYLPKEIRDPALNIPFTVKTLYPNISQDISHGSLVCTGKNCIGEIRALANCSNDHSVRMYWAMKSAGYQVSYDKPTKDYSARLFVEHYYPLHNLGPNKCYRYSACFKPGRCMPRCFLSSRGEMGETLRTRFEDIKSLKYANKADIEAQAQTIFSPIARLALPPRTQYDRHADLFANSKAFRSMDDVSPFVVRGASNFAPGQTEQSTDNLDEENR